MTATFAHAVSIPHAATRAERVGIRASAALMRWLTQRAEARAERRERMLERLHAEQTAAPDPRALDIALLSIGSRPR